MSFLGKITGQIQQHADNLTKVVNKHKDLPLIREGINRTLAEVRGTWNPNHRHDDPDEIEKDKIRAAINASHRFESFANIRQRNTVKWYIDGHDYFWAVAEILEAAKECIFILDWWLSPELYLKRPPADYQEYRLDRLLKRKAEQGVKVYVIVYKEVTQTMNMSSHHTKNALQELHPNIIVLRHPDHIGTDSSVQFWSHHEKVIVVDNHRACIGGLDACFGRWDTQSHPLADVHPTDFSRTLFPGQDWNNARVQDFQQVDNYVSNTISILDTPRMPWHDVHMSFVGDAVLDVVQHFVERWNEIKTRKYANDSKYDWLAFPHDVNAAPGEPIQRHPHRETFHEVGRKFRNRWHEMKDDWDGDDNNDRREEDDNDENRYGGSHTTRPGTCTVQVCRSVSDWSHGVLTERSIQNAYLQLIREANHYIYIENQFFISSTNDKSPVKNQIARALVDRILIAAKEGKKFKVIVVIPEVPGFSGDIQQENGIKTIMAAQWRTINRGGSSIYEEIRNAGYEPLDYIRFYHLRSYDRINAPASFIKQMEQNSGVSFHEAQVALARCWIGDDGFWHQKTVKIKAPAWEKPDQANLGTTEKSAVEEIAEVNFPPSTQAAYDIVKQFESGAPRGDEDVSDSIAQHLLEDVTDLRDERWLGTEQEEKDCFVTELLYIHSKLMIVDDRRVIMGSANINDRSQKGDGDSEIALVVEDTDMIETTMDGRPYMAGRFAATLRRKLYREHLGLIPPQYCVTGEEPVTSFMRAAPYPNDDETNLREDWMVRDPISDDLMTLWTNTARTNREMFQQVFKTVPTDTVRNWEQYKNFVPKVKTGHIASDLPLPQIKDKLARIRGALVEAPINFLIEQKELIDNADWRGLNPSLPIFI
ncbi:hypothetical protein FRC03_004555 [Tulasnella sp. 419]|nr:hypothetical protein FRC03_004555 [Tulasnella sp. 419]